MQPGQEDVDEAADPGPFGRRPQQVAGLRQELVRHLHAGQMSEQHPVRVQGPFRRAGRSRSVDHQRRIVGGGVGRREGRACARERLGPADRVMRRTVDRDHDAQLGQISADPRELGKPRRVRDERPRAGVAQAIAERIDAEQGGERHGDGAELVDGDMRGRRCRTLGQQDRDAIAGRDPVRREHVGEAVRGLAQGAVGDGSDAAVGRHVENGDARGIAGRPAVADVDADIVALRDTPAEGGEEAVVIADLGQHRCERAWLAGASAGARHQFTFRSAAGGRNCPSKMSSTAGFCR